MKVKVWVDENGWGHVECEDEEQIVAEIVKRFGVHEGLAGQLLRAFCDRLRGESTVYQDELLGNHPDVVEFLESITEE